MITSPGKQDVKMTMCVQVYEYAVQGGISRMWGNTICTIKGAHNDEEQTKE
jgi:hypothetical protein